VTEAQRNEAAFQKPTPPEDNRPWWKRLLYSLRPDIRSWGKYIGIKGGIKF
jgi:hypothetical protein